MPKKSTTILKPLADGHTVPVYRWSPNRPNETNFGDELGPMIVRALLMRHGKHHLKVIDAPKADRSKLLTVGSILHFVGDGDVIWGAGVNGKVWPKNLNAVTGLHVTSVRGPLTRDVLSRFAPCPEVFGDPALLFPMLYAEELDQAIAMRRLSGPVGGAIFIPNLNDLRLMPERPAARDDVRLVRPDMAPLAVAAEIALADVVLASSLHGLVLADALGVATRPVASLFEPAFKYLDYYEGTGRSSISFSVDFLEALNAVEVPPAQFDAAALLAAFPIKRLDVTA